jgi:hypothetical protein
VVISTLNIPSLISHLNGNVISETILKAFLQRLEEDNLSIRSSETSGEISDSNIVEIEGSELVSLEQTETAVVRDETSRQF